MSSVSNSYSTIGFFSNPHVGMEIIEQFASFSPSSCPSNAGSFDVFPHDPNHLSPREDALSSDTITTRSSTESVFELQLGNAATEKCCSIL